jgi:LPXTG-motif cell wall-anchored protein
VASTLAPPLGRIPDTGTDVGMLVVIAGSLLVAGASAIAATGRKPTK